MQKPSGSERMVELVRRATRRLLLPATLGTRQVVFKVDTGASCSLVPWSDVQKGGLEDLVDVVAVKVGGMQVCGILHAPLLCKRSIALWGLIHVSEECREPLLGLDVLFNHRCSIVPSRSLPHLVVREMACRVPRSVPLTRHLVTLNGHPADALLDTGASHSLIPLDLVHALGLMVVQRQRAVTLFFTDGSEDSTEYVPHVCICLGGREALEGRGEGGRCEDVSWTCTDATGTLFLG
ncbi:uncharacterized protein LOC123510388 [Portunus trituberculatus]|uniref:uncharacterized protein LOC123510388 n=1 Tax=Portunus trituberculatus TaxID=210409 RepID=UPI001E1CC316|nr:uncharacterized protein LOC123510388 [Portunus trituberculatus]